MGAVIQINQSPSVVLIPNQTIASSPKPDQAQKQLSGAITKTKITHSTKMRDAPTSNPLRKKSSFTSLGDTQPINEVTSGEGHLDQDTNPDREQDTQEEHIIEVNFADGVTDVSSPHHSHELGEHTHLDATLESIKGPYSTEVQLTDNVEGGYQDYAPLIQNYLKTMHEMEEMLTRLETSRSFAILFRKYPKIIVPAGFFIVLFASLAFNPAFFAIAIYSASNPETNEFMFRQFTDLLKYLEYREKMLLQGSINLTPRPWESLFRNKLFGTDYLNRYQQGLYSAMQNGIHSQEYLKTYGSWHEGLLPKRIAIKTMIKQAENFYTQHSEAINAAINNQQQSPIMDTFVRDHLQPLLAEAELLISIYKAKIQSSLDSYANKNKGATNLSRNYERKFTDHNQEAREKAAEAFNPVIRVLDTALLFYRSNSNTARKIQEDGNQLGKILEQQILKPSSTTTRSAVNH